MLISEFNLKKFLPIIIFFILFIIISAPVFGQVICEGCNKPVTGDYWTLEGHVYCSECFSRYAPRCDLCNAILVEEYIFNEYTGNKFCNSCGEKYPACSSCGNPIGPSGSRIDSSRYLCADCTYSAIFNYNKLALVYQEAFLQLKSLGLEIRQPVANLTMMSQTELNNYNPEHSSERGFCETWSSDGVPYAHRIFILNGLPYKEALEVMSHELAHAWQMENNPDMKVPFWVEGFAEWVAYKVMINKGYSNNAALLQGNPDSVYGGGLRYLINFEAYYGKDATIEYIKDL